MTHPIGSGDRPRPSATASARPPDDAPRTGGAGRPKAGLRCGPEAPPASPFRARLAELGPGAGSARRGVLGDARLGQAGVDLAPVPAGRRAGLAALGERSGTEPARRDRSGAETSGADAPALAPADLAPFRVPPSILAPPIARAQLEPPVLDPALFSAEIVESLRLGRVGRDGHALTMRLRGARSAIEVDVRSEAGRISLRLSGDDEAEVARMRARVHADLAARGIEVDDEA